VKRRPQTMNAPRFLLLALCLSARWCSAGEELVTTAPYGSGDTVAYVLNSENPSPKYVLILFPGGTGSVGAHMENGKLVYMAKGNFLLRARKFIVDNEFATVATDSTELAARVQALIDDLKARFPSARIYLVGTSRGTYDTMALAPYLSERIAGEIHTSSMRDVATFDARKYRNRQLLVHHREDGCRVTPLFAAQMSHDRYGTELIVMEGGISTGDPCEAFAHHGYNGIEKETAEAIKQWVRQGG
jgi:hypothetical protein